MDGASAVAGIISLAALTAVSTANLIKILKAIKNAPQAMEKHLRWLNQLALLLKDIQHVYSNVNDSDAGEEVAILEQILSESLDAIRQLTRLIERRIPSIDESSAVKRNIVRLKFSLGSKEIEQQIIEIQRLLESLHLCHSINIRYVRPAESDLYSRELTVSYGRRIVARTDAISQGIATTVNQLATKDDFLQVKSHFSQSNSTDPRESNHRAHNDLGHLVNKIDATTLNSRELLWRLERSIDSVATAQDATHHKLEAIVQSMLGDVSSSMAEKHGYTQPSSTIHSQQLYDDPQQSLQGSTPIEIFDGDETHSPIQSSNVFRSATSRERSVHIRKSERQIYAKHFRNLLGVFELAAYQSYGRRSLPYSEANEEDLIDVEVTAIPNKIFSIRAVRAEILFRRSHGLSSPTNIRLSVPVIRDYADPIVGMVKEGRMAEIKTLFAERGHRPNDLYLYQDKGWHLEHQWVPEGPGEPPEWKFRHNRHNDCEQTLLSVRMSAYLILFMSPTGIFYLRFEKTLVLHRNLSLE